MVSSVWVELLIISILAPAVGKEENWNLQKPDSNCKKITANTCNLLLMALKSCDGQISQGSSNLLVQFI